MMMMMMMMTMMMMMMIVMIVMMMMMMMMMMIKHYLYRNQFLSFSWIQLANIVDNLTETFEIALVQTILMMMMI